MLFLEHINSDEVLDILRFDRISHYITRRLRLPLLQLLDKALRVLLMSFPARFTFNTSEVARELILGLHARS